MIFGGYGAAMTAIAAADRGFVDVVALAPFAAMLIQLAVSRSRE